MNIINKRTRIRHKLAKTGAMYRVTVNKTNSYFSAQVLEIATGKVLAAVHQKTFETKAKLAKAKPVEVIGKMGEVFGKVLLDKKISEIAFDRSGYIYHGKVKAFADGLRTAGLKF